MRPDGWEDRFFAELQRHKDLPGEYGVSDCWYVCMDTAAAIVQRDLDYEFVYSNAIGAAIILQEHGWRTVAEGFGTFFPEIPPSLASRGDIGVVEWDNEICGVVVLGPDVVGKHPVKGIVRVPRASLRRAFRVE